MKGMSTMIKIRIRNDDHEIDLQFPISENKLYAKLAEIHAIEGKDAPQSAFVTEVYWPEELSMLKDRFANLDELNYLARRMESFDYHEYDQFLIGITKLENPTEKDLINLTFNLDHFTLCKDVSNYGKIGREYSRISWRGCSAGHCPCAGLPGTSCRAEESLCRIRRSMPRSSAVRSLPSLSSCRRKTPTLSS